MGTDHERVLRVRALVEKSSPICYRNPEIGANGLAPQLIPPRRCDRTKVFRDEAFHVVSDSVPGAERGVALVGAVEC